MDLDLVCGLLILIRSKRTVVIEISPSITKMYVTFRHNCILREYVEMSIYLIFMKLTGYTIQEKIHKQI